MELNENTWEWIVAGAIAVIFVLYWTISRVLERRRRAWVDGLSTTFGATAAHGAYATSRFDVLVNGRRCEVAQGYRSRTMDGRYIHGSRLIVTVPLRHVSDIYNLSFRRRDGARTPESLSLRDSGYHPHEGWLTEGLRGAIFDFYDVAGDRQPLDIEGGALTYGTSRRISGKTLQVMVDRQLAVAAEIETALSNRV